ncbi:MAG TPA: FAD-binding oxidoreductase, partial [Gemmatimonadetes bacterium]|nr:FAD-binding oxidoreductase [Gemmatimonadota bacterium]
MTLARSLRSALPDVSAREWDQSNNDVLWPGGTPEVLIRPVSTEEVSQILTWAGKEGVGVLPLGSGRHLGPIGGGRFVALETSLLAGVDEYEPADLTITSGTGTTFSTVDSTLRENGQWAPFDSPGVNERSIGGLVSEASHGPLWAGYGSLRNHVLGATLVTGDGRVLRLGGKVVKNV